MVIGENTAISVGYNIAENVKSYSGHVWYLKIKDGEENSVKIKISTIADVEYLQNALNNLEKILKKRL